MLSQQNQAPQELSNLLISKEKTDLVAGKRQWSLSDFDFELPKELIAQQPRQEKAKTPLLVFKNQQIFDHKFADLPDFFEAGDLLVFNQARVIKASLQAINLSNSAKINLNLNQQNGSFWSAFCKPGKKVAAEDFLEISKEFGAKVLKKEEDGSIWLEFFCDGRVCNDKSFFEQIEKCGAMPLPPYIKRKDGFLHGDDEKNYQNIYAKTGAAVAAPTAGLHFNEEIFTKLAAKKIKTAFLNLDVGAGTFLPVRSNQISEHKMHSENFCLDEEVCKLVNQTKENGKKVIAVGTTSLRALEASATKLGTVFAQKNSTKIFIYPPYQFKIVDILLTNFHLPKSTLLMLVCAFVGYEEALKIYQHAITNQYRFFSYGDSSLLFR